MNAAMRAADEADRLTFVFGKIKRSDSRDA
jgi:hypothetical protein